MKLLLKKDIAPLRQAMKTRIDEEAENMRALFLTPGAGQAAVYEQKRIEAEAFMANESIGNAEIPHLAEEASRNGISVFDQAVIYLSLRQRWLNASSIIERLRLDAKDAVDRARTPAEIETVSKINWEPVTALAV